MKRRSIVVIALAVATAWTASAASGDGGPSPGISYGWDGVARGNARFVALPAGRNTVVAVVRTGTGRVVRFGMLRGSFGVPLVAHDGTAGGLSRDGKTLVLATYVSPGARATRFAFVSTRTLRPRRVVELRGAYSFDALSPDAATLYLTQYLSGQGAGYRVRAWDVPAGRLLPRAIVDRLALPKSMGGAPVTRAESRDGRWAYTLYAGGPKPFVHALDTVGRRAVCLDVAWRGSQDAIWRLRLAVSHDGRQLELRRGARTVMTIGAPG